MDQVPPTLPEPLAHTGMPGEAPFPVPEDTLVAQVGLGRRVVRELRSSDFLQGADWALVAGKICWSEKAAVALLARLSPQNGVEHLPAASELAPAAPGAAAVPLVEPPKVLRVLRANFPNTRIVMCVEEEEEKNGNGHPPTELITVRVREAGLFKPGMRLLARPGIGSAWEFLGNPERPAAGARYPRRPGRW